MPKFTERLIADLKPEPGRKDRLLFDTESPGLGLRVNRSGKKTFLVQWSDKATGVKRREPLGVWGGITLTKAREAARIVLGRVAAGGDPAIERREKKAAHEVAKKEAALTLEVLVADWEKLHLSGRRPGYARDAPAALRRAFAKDLAKPAAALSHERVIAVIDKIASDGKPVAAARAMAYGRAAYGWPPPRRRSIAWRRSWRSSSAAPLPALRTLPALPSPRRRSARPMRRRRPSAACRSFWPR